MIDIDSPGWYIFLLAAVAVMLYFIWRFLNETKRIQEKLKGMKSFGDIIDATNQALDEFNEAFDEAGKVIEKRKQELDKLLGRAESSIRRLEELIDKASSEPKYEQQTLLDVTVPAREKAPVVKEASGERVEDIKKHLAAGKTHDEISRLTGASMREVKLVERFTGGQG